MYQMISPRDRGDTRFQKWFLVVLCWDRAAAVDRRGGLSRTDHETALSAASSSYGSRRRRFTIDIATTTNLLTGGHRRSPRRHCRRRLAAREDVAAAQAVFDAWVHHEAKNKKDVRGATKTARAVLDAAPAEAQPAAEAVLAAFVAHEATTKRHEVKEKTEAARAVLDVTKQARRARSRGLAFLTRLRICRWLGRGRRKARGWRWPHGCAAASATTAFFFVVVVSLHPSSCCFFSSLDAAGGRTGVRGPLGNGMECGMM